MRSEKDEAEAEAETCEAEADATVSNEAYHATLSLSCHIS